MFLDSEDNTIDGYTVNIIAAKTKNELEENQRVQLPERTGIQKFWDPKKSLDLRVLVSQNSRIQELWDTRTFGIPEL